MATTSEDSMNKPGNHVETNDMAPSTSDETPKAPDLGSTEAPETEHIKDEGEPIGSNFA